jgi:hypothetical protein
MSTACEFAATPGPAYPLARPRHDARFSVGLALDISAVLTRHGYPPITTGDDHLHWQQALHTAIYRPHREDTP